MRHDSTRLPGKALKMINGRPMIEWQIKRIMESKVNRLIVATTTDTNDDEIEELCLILGVEVFRGNVDDVYSRYKSILSENKSDYFLRLTGDCPLVMPKIIDSMIDYFEKNSFDYLSNTNPPTFPDGLDVEVVNTRAFLELENYKMTDQEREHVTLGMYRRPDVFTVANFINSTDMNHERWTVDYEEDLEFIREIYAEFTNSELSFDLAQVVNLLKSNPGIRNTKSADYRNIALNIEGESN